MSERHGRARLKPGCRPAPSGDVLLIPEGALRLQGPALQIVQLCDGSRTIAEIVSALMEQYTGANPAEVSEETTSFLRQLAERGVVEFV